MAEVIVFGPPPVPACVSTDTIHVLSSTVRFGSAFISVRISREKISCTDVGLFTAFSRMYNKRFEKRTGGNRQ